MLTWLQEEKHSRSLVWLIGVVVCLLTAPQIQLSIGAG